MLMFIMILYRYRFGQWFVFSCFVWFRDYPILYIYYAHQEVSRFSRDFGFHIEVETVDDHIMSASRVFCRCFLNMFSERFPIDLVPIPLRWSKFIILMDWLGLNRVVIDYERQLVRDWTPSGGELVITDERASHGPTLYSAARSRRYLSRVIRGI